MFYIENDVKLGLLSIPSKSLEEKRRSKGCDVDVARGPKGKGAPTIASSRHSSRSLIFLIFSAPRQLVLKPNIQGRLVVLYISASSRERPRSISVSTFIVSPYS